MRALLGAGGMGEVYLAHDLRLGRDVALKILRRSVAADPGYLRRFEDEARSASVLNHPNIVTIYGVGDDGDIGYIAMERVNGRTLTEIIASADLAVPAVLELAVQLAEALAVAHDKGIVHRDLKPDNVMVTPEGLVKVLDFGIAKREGALDDQTISRGPADGPMLETQAGTILGTVGYMSPEQAAGRRASAGLGPVLLRRHPLRVAHRAAGVRPQFEAGHARRDPARRAGADSDDQCQRAAGPATGPRSLSREGSGRALWPDAGSGDRAARDSRAPGRRRPHAPAADLARHGRGGDRRLVRRFDLAVLAARAAGEVARAPAV